MTSSCGMTVTEHIWSVDITRSIWVFVGDDGSIYTSTDAASSCTKRTSGTTVEMNDVFYGNSKFVAVGYSGTILTSTNGITWTSRTSGTTNSLFGGNYMEYSVYKEHAVVGASGKYVYSHNNGTSWSTWSSSLTTDVTGVVRGGTTWVFVGPSGTIYSMGDDDDVTARVSGTTESLRRVFYKE